MPSEPHLRRQYALSKPGIIVLLRPMFENLVTVYVANSTETICNNEVVNQS
jgi:hypothetical protein